MRRNVAEKLINIHGVRLELDFCCVFEVRSDFLICQGCGLVSGVKPTGDKWRVNEVDWV